MVDGRSCLLLGLAAVAGCSHAARSPVRSNQHGYLPDAAKIAVVESDEAQPLAWVLRSRRGKTVARGETTVRGVDAESGDRVHWVDFSSVRATGDDFVLHVGRKEGPPFSIGNDVYRNLKYDALAYFYHNRSGTPIVEPYVPKKYTRPAGHLSDRKVTCAGKLCTYSLDASGGWYDAGDHGKYVVNGGIAVWTLLDLYERLQQLGATAGDFADGQLNIPERDNGVPDLLDEARWELEFLLKMEIPAGLEHAGMVHHKLHDSAWTSIGFMPPEHAEHRYLHPPSTAATLNLTATAAQCARIFVKLDPDLAKRCKGAAIRTWNAAQKEPAKYATSADTQGG